MRGLTLKTARLAPRSGVDVKPFLCLFLPFLKKETKKTIKIL